MQPWEFNTVINCGGVSIRPGDAVIGDQDGVVVVPATVAEEVHQIAESRERIEAVIKAELEANPGPPGKYYPFKPPIKPESPLGAPRRAAEESRTPRSSSSSSSLLVVVVLLLRCRRHRRGNLPHAQRHAPPSQR